jgi:hypothetical protein
MQRKSGLFFAHTHAWCARVIRLSISLSVSVFPSCCSSSWRCDTGGALLITPGTYPVRLALCVSLKNNIANLLLKLVSAWPAMNYWWHIKLNSLARSQTRAHTRPDALPEEQIYSRERKECVQLQWAQIVPFVFELSALLQENEIVALHSHALLMYIPLKNFLCYTIKNTSFVDEGIK